MFTPAHFEQKDRRRIIEFMAANPLATLVLDTPTGMEANHIPVVVIEDSVGRLRLQGHIARANPLWQHAEAVDALAIFHGPHAYVSPSAYPTKAEHGRVVPTWNYIAVHANGIICFIDDRDWKRSLVERLTNRHESALAAPWSVDDAPADFTDRMLKALVGFEIDVQSLNGKWKLSQNQPEANRLGVIAAFEQQGDAGSAAVAEQMKASAE